MITTARSLGLLICLAFSLGCSHEDSRDASRNQRLIISAAASTTELVEALAEQFTRQTGVEVKANFGPSNGLAAQIIEGAPADLFLSASEDWAQEVEKSGLAAASAPFLTNKLVIVVPSDNPANVRQPEDLLHASVKKIALAGENVPAGKYADQALTRLNLLDALVAENKIVRGQSVRSALSFVEQGEAEAGIVYSTDVTSAKNVSIAAEFAPSLHDDIVYVLVLLKPSAANADAQSLYEYLQSDAADSTLQRLGFSRIAVEKAE